MKITNILIAAIAATLSFTACDKAEKEKLQTLNQALLEESKNDSVQISGMAVEIAQLRTSLDSMRALEAKIRKPEGGAVVAKEELTKLQKLLAANQRKVNELELKLQESNSQNVLLNTLIEELRKTITDKEQTIADLNSQVEALEQELTNTKAEKAAVEDKLTQTENEMNTAFFVVGTKKELAEKGIIDRGGLFNTQIDGFAQTMKASDFNKVDIRYFEEIAIGEQKEKNVSMEPERSAASYRIENRDGKLYLKIIDKDEFWKTSKYLAVIVK